MFVKFSSSLYNASSSNNSPAAPNKMSYKSVLEFGLIFEIDYKGKINYILNLIKSRLFLPYENSCAFKKMNQKSSKNAKK